jgi:ABC-type bacteriocin/lantibiotic exporter with double-glycine peptidase domain
VLLCDEVTSSIDPLSDEHCHATLLSLDATLLMICHRLTHIHSFDTVIVSHTTITRRERQDTFITFQQ